MSSVAQGVYVESDGDEVKKAIATSNNGNLLAQIVDEVGHTPMVSVFGDLSVANRHADILAKFAHGLSSFEAIKTVTGTGNHDTNNGALTITTGASTNSSCMVESRDAVRYIAGNQMYANFTAAWLSTPVTGSVREIGFTNKKDGFLILDDAGTMKVRHIRTNGATYREFARKDWDDRLDGTGESGLNIDFSKTNIFQITFGHLGIAPVIFWVHNGNRFVPFHAFYYANLQTEPHLVNPYLEMICKVTNTTNANAATLLTASWNCGTLHGVNMDETSSNRRFNQESITTSLTTERPVLSIKNKADYPTGGLENFVKVLINSIQGVCEGNGSNTVKFRLYKNATLNAGTTTYSDKDSVNSCVQVNTGATGFTGGTQLWFDVASRNNGFRFTVNDKNIYLYPSETLTLTAQSASNVSAEFSFDWIEKH
jgi:hypothetical protein